MTKTNKRYPSSSSLNVNIDHAKAVPEMYRCDRCRCDIDVPDLDGSLWDVPFDLSCGHRCCWDCTQPEVGSLSRCPHCYRHVHLRYDVDLFKALEERPAPASPASFHSDSTLVYEQPCSNERYRRGEGVAEPSRSEGVKGAGPQTSNDTEYSSDSDGVLGEMSEEEEEDDDDDDDSEGGGARCDTSSSILERPKRRSPVDVFHYMESKNVMAYQEKENEQEQEQEKWPSHQPVSREPRRRPKSFAATRRYSTTPVLEVKGYSITPSMAAQMPPVFEVYENESMYSLSSTRCEFSPTRVEDPRKRPPNPSKVRFKQDVFVINQYG